MQGFTSLLGRGHSRHSSTKRPGTQTTVNEKESKGWKENENERGKEKEDRRYR